MEQLIKRIWNSSQNQKKTRKILPWKTKSCVSQKAGCRHQGKRTVFPRLLLHDRYQLTIADEHATAESEAQTVAILFFYFNFIVIQVQFSAFPPHPSPTPSPLHLPPVSTSPHNVIVQVSFIIVPTNTSPSSPEIPSPLPSGHCRPFLNFSVFGYILLVCLFC